MTTFVVAEIPTAHDTICSDCDGDWYLPAAAIGALAFFVLGYSVFNFSVGNWAQQFLEPSKTVNGAHLMRLSVCQSLPFCCNACRCSTRLFSPFLRHSSLGYSLLVVCRAARIWHFQA